MDDKRLFAPSTARNREPILGVLRNVLPAKGSVLEIASGAGEHVTFFAVNFPHLTFCPSDPNAEARESVSAWIASTGSGNARAPLALHVEELPWPISAADAIICINMTHISPWSATEALFEGAGRILPRRERRSIYTVHIDAAAPTPRQAMQNSTRAFARAIRRGEFAISKMSRPAPARKGLESLKSWKCPPIISASSFAARDKMSRSRISKMT
jgi:hypothetical protein